MIGPLELQPRPGNHDVTKGAEDIADNAEYHIIGPAPETKQVVYVTCPLAGLKTAGNRPFAATCVPLRFLARDRRVASVMIEVRRGLYCEEETGWKIKTLGQTKTALATLVKAASAA